MKKSILALLLIIFFQNSVWARNTNLDSVYKFPTNTLWKYILSEEVQDCNITFEPGEDKMIPLLGTDYYGKSLQAIKSSKDIYIFIHHSGVVFKYFNLEDSLLVFKRIDQTVNLNYNIGSKTFLFKGDIYNYGGYGFWKSNGLLRKYNKVDQEWDIVPLNMEIFSADINWYDKKEGRVYVPYQVIINTGIIGGDKPKVDLKSYYLDIAQNKWVKLGVFDPGFIELTSNDLLHGTVLENENGYLFILEDQVYFFNFRENKIYKSKNVQLNQILVRRKGNLKMFVNKEEIFFYDIGNDKLINIHFTKNDFVEMPFPIWSADNTTYWWVFSGVIVLIAFILVAFIVRKKIKNKLQIAQLKMLKTKSIQQAFSETEITLIHLLLEAHSKDKKVEIHEINHVLGIKDKNVGLQKKVRSDVMNAINDKYQFIVQSDTALIASVRKEDDKRFYEYFITASEIKNIQKLIQEKSN
jgi:hypothetical protein